MSHSMTVQHEAKPWDFSRVLNVVNDLEWKDDYVPRLRTSSEQRCLTERRLTRSSILPQPHKGQDRVATKDFAPAPQDLGDFAKIWQFLGVPPTPQVPIATATLGIAQSDEDTVPSKIDYASDGATYVHSSRKKENNAVQFQDDTSGGEQTTDTGDAVSDMSGLTKTQRKKLRRKQRKTREAAEAIKNATMSESEADAVNKKTPAKMASVHVPFSEPVKRFTNPRLLPNNPLIPSKPRTTSNADQSAPPTAVKGTLAEPATPPPKHMPSSSPPSKQADLNPSNHLSTPSIQVSDARTAHQQALSRIQQPNAMNFFPSTVQPPSKHVSGPTNEITQPLQAQPLQPRIANTLAPNSARKPGPVIGPKIIRSGEDRNWALLMKIISDFWEDRKYLISPANLTTHNNHPDGIHLFVDASNIFIGFNDQLKRSRGIPLHRHVTSADLSFDALALLMERRRPVARRVLAGSNPHLPAFDKAEEVGYELNILEKVYKARELTERQKHFNAVDAGLIKRGTKAPQANSVGLVSKSFLGTSPPNALGYSSSGSEKTAPEYAKAKMIEQGVDEILHMKMMQSLLDWEVPSTMVLATGDAAAAEYSDGFMATVERALKKGWTVELVSWSKNINSLYRRRAWTEAWGDRFRIIELDDYAEELLDM